MIFLYFFKEATHICLDQVIKSTKKFCTSMLKIQPVSYTHLIELLESIDNKLSSFNIENPKKGGNTIQMNKFEQLLEQYGKTVEDITFDYESMSDEELEVKFKEVFEVKNDEPKTLVRSYEISHEDTRYALYNLLSAAEDNDNEWYFINSVYDLSLIHIQMCIRDRYSTG